MYCSAYVNVDVLIFSKDMFMLLLPHVPTLQRYSEKLVSQLKKELEKTQLNTARSQSALKEMQANILQMEEVKMKSNFPCKLVLHTLI